MQLTDSIRHWYKCNLWLLENCCAKYRNYLIEWLLCTNTDVISIQFYTQYRATFQQHLTFTQIEPIYDLPTRRHAAVRSPVLITYSNKLINVNILLSSQTCSAMVLALRLYIWALNCKQAIRTPCRTPTAAMCRLNTKHNNP